MNTVTDTERIDALIAAVQKDHELRLHDGTLPSRGCFGLGLNCFGNDLRRAIDIALLRKKVPAPPNYQVDFKTRHIPAVYCAESDSENPARSRFRGAQSPNPAV